MAIAVGAVILFAVWLASDTRDIDPSDPGWADIAFFVSPILAFAAAFVIGLVLIVVSLLRLIDLRPARAAGAMVVGLIGAPIIYIVVLILAASALDGVQSSAVLACVTFVVPAICGTTVTLIAALIAAFVGRRRTAS